MGSFYRQQLEDWLKTLDIKCHIIYDVGGGQGEVVKRLRSFQADEYKVLDLPKYDLEKVGDWNHLPPADVIFCLEVFEYLIDPLKALGNIAYIMKKGGKAYITFQFVYPHHNELERDSLRYTEFGVRRLADEAGLDVGQIHYRVDKSGILNDFYSADGMRRAKQYGHHDATGFIVELIKP